ncbi:MAG: archease [Candidatus Rehaiarchaeum fermentans]|nr:archease [Candidatus Rehaiarchaeum fermentans]MCW1293711.1 archease [Candidatus Rehaiarchaeum fermentans]MCW1297222.1 archease [Candidatus Rehaiarchaeum fermentans]MCW1302244.1 archease [Candidatus Rehaiarchaeum fermentans]MCW1311388.1 archease [Candidatus Rehaiarchaeum fermentans]
MRKFYFVENENIADAAIKVIASSLNELFRGAAEALSFLMIENADEIEEKERVKINIKANSYYKLLYKFLNKIIYYKDTKGLVFSKFLVKINKKNLNAICYGDVLKPKYQQLVDAKSVTMHKIYVKKKSKFYEAHFVVDI